MAYIGPLARSAHGINGDGCNWVVYAAAYQTVENGRCRIWKHRTAKAALRRLGSVTSGKLRMNGDYIAVAVAPDGSLWNWTELKTGFRRF